MVPKQSWRAHLRVSTCLVPLSAMPHLVKRYQWGDDVTGRPVIGDDGLVDMEAADADYVSVGNLPRTGRGGPLSRQVPGVWIDDVLGGASYQVAVEDRDGKYAIIFLLTIPHARQGLDEVVRIPDSDLASIAGAYYVDHAPPRGRGEIRFDEPQVQRPTVKGYKPAPHILKQIIETTLATNGSPRRVLALRFGVDVKTADDWLADARRRDRKSVV